MRHHDGRRRCERVGEDLIETDGLHLTTSSNDLGPTGQDQHQEDRVEQQEVDEHELVEPAEQELQDVNHCPKPAHCRSGRPCRRPPIAAVLPAGRRRGERRENETPRRASAGSRRLPARRSAGSRRRRSSPPRGRCRGGPGPTAGLSPRANQDAREPQPRRSARFATDS